MNTASYSFVGPEVETLNTQLIILTHQHKISFKIHFERRNAALMAT
jgi:hypothetical protein